MVYIAQMLSKAEQTKQFIIEKAAPLFNKKGYAATSMNDILLATGMAKGGVYGHFSSKDEIALAVFDYASKQLMEAIAAQIKSQKTASEKLCAIFNFYHDYATHPLLEGGCPLLNSAIDSDYNFPELKKRTAIASQLMLDSLTHIIHKGIHYGEFSKHVDANFESKLIFAIIEGGMMMSRLKNDPQHLNQLLNYLKIHIKTYH